CAETLLPFAPMQTDLLSPSTTVDSPERLLERLRARLGDAAICGLGRIDEH
ncbi:MAG: DNA repair nucleotidyltransferase, partial [Lysobacterales bacterium CG_4_9_14_3_um_filter_62_6]